MSFIGIIADEKNEEILKRVLEYRLNMPNKEYTIIIINNKSADNIKNIRFETILIISFEQVEEKMNAVIEILAHAKYLVINVDIEKSLSIINNMELNIITFGFNQKATITTSSIENSFTICVQRRILDINMNPIEPQEITVEIIEKRLRKNSHNSMGIASMLLIYGKKEIKF